MAKPETSEQQQSYFYVVWPEERSPAAGATASSTPNLVAMNTAGSSVAPIDTFLTSSSSSPPGYSGQGAHPSSSASTLGPLIGATGHSPSSSAAGAGTAAALSGTEDSDSSVAGSPATTSSSQAASTAIIAAAQTITVTESAGEFSGGISTTPHNVLISPRSHAFGLAANGAGTINTVYNPVSSPGLIYVSDASSVLSSRSTIPAVCVPASHSAHPHVGHHHLVSAHHHAAPVPGHRGNGSSIAGPLLQESPRKQQHSRPSSTEASPLRNIGM